MEQGVPGREVGPAGDAVLSDAEVPQPRPESPLRRRMLDAAQRLVERAGGLTVGLDALSLDQVIKEAGVARTSVYREWENKDDFALDVLCDLAGPSWQGTAAFDEATITLARDVIVEHIQDLRTPEGRRQVLLGAIRLAARQNFLALTSSTQWRTYVALTATVMSSEPKDRARILAALQAAETSFLSRMADFYSDLAGLLGLRLRTDELTFELLAAAGASIVEGVGLRQFLTPEVVHQPLRGLADDAGAEDWHLAALGFLAIFDMFVEPIPDEEYNLELAVAAYVKRISDRESALSARK